MSHDKGRKALRYLMFLIEKCDRSIKARVCADCRSQYEYTTIAEAVSLTISLEAMMLKCAIDTKEGRHVAVTVIPGAFLHSDINEYMQIVLEA